MFVLIAVLLVLVPAAAMIYPFLRGVHLEVPLEDEASDSREISRRWDMAVAGLHNTELEFSLGNLTKDDYNWLREQYMTEAAVVLKAMELEEHQAQEMMANVERVARGIRGHTEFPKDQE